MKKFIIRVYCLGLVIFFLLASIVSVSLDRNFYTKQYQKNNTTKYTGLSAQDLDTVTDNLLNYLTGKRENLDMQFEVDGQVREIFDEREKTHMIDVKKLYLNVVYITLALAAALAGTTIFALSKGKELADNVLRTYKKALILTVVFIALAGAVFYLNFDWFWTNFHLVFFTNDLWILDPEISIMINMFPLEFFNAICTKIVITFAILNILTFALLVLWQKKVQKSNAYK